MNSTSLRDQLHISAQLVYDELLFRNIPVTILSAPLSLLEYNLTNGETHLLFSTCSDKSSAIGVVIANSKAQTAVLATQLNIPIPAQIVGRDIRKIRTLLSDHGKIVIKPVSEGSGRGVSTNITTPIELSHAYVYAKKYGHDVVAQQHVEGDDIRLLIVNGTFSSAVIRKPAHVTGDGASTIRELIMATNTLTIRNDTTTSSLMHININAAARFLHEKIDTIPESGQECRVVGPANVSLGGSLHEATQLVNASMIADAEAITQKLGLGICGVDMMWNRITGKHYLIEVNATPGIDIHNDQFSGTSSDCVSQYVDWLTSED